MDVFLFCLFHIGFHFFQTVFESLFICLMSDKQSSSSKWSVSGVYLHIHNVPFCVLFTKKFRMIFIQLFAGRSILPKSHEKKPKKEVKKAKKQYFLNQVDRFDLPRADCFSSALTVN